MKTFRVWLSEESFVELKADYADEQFIEPPATVRFWKQERGPRENTIMAIRISSFVLVNIKGWLEVAHESRS